MNGPMYLQIAETMRERVINGQFKPGQALPPERELMGKFSVSRVTVRRALRELVNESLLESRQGSGYIVQSLAPLQQPLNRITSFSEDCLARGLKPGSIFIERTNGKSNAKESAHFHVPLNTDVLLIKRVRTGAGEPMLVEHATLLASKAPEWPWPEGSLYLAMQRQNRVPTRVFQEYSPVVADQALAAHLDVTVHSPIMLVVRAGYCVNNEPVEYSHCWFRPDRWTFAHEIMQ